MYYLKNVIHALHIAPPEEDLSHHPNLYYCKDLAGEDLDLEPFPGTDHVPAHHILTQDQDHHTVDPLQDHVIVTQTISFTDPAEALVHTHVLDPGHHTDTEQDMTAMRNISMKD